MLITLPCCKQGLYNRSIDCIFSLSQLLHIGDEQRRDPHISRLIQRLESSPYDASARTFALKDNTLYRRNLSSARSNLPLVIPKHLRSTVREFHGAPTASHFGVSRRYDSVRRRFYWLGLTRSVRSYVDACDTSAGHFQPTTFSWGTSSVSVWTLSAPFQHPLPETSGMRLLPIIQLATQSHEHCQSAVPQTLLMLYYVIFI